LNDSAYKDRALPYSKILDGGMLFANMSPAPDYNVFVKADTTKKNSSGFSESIVPAPVIIASKNVFRDSVEVEIKSLDKNTIALYHDPFDPVRPWKKATSKLIVDSTCTVKAMAVVKNGTRPGLSQAFFYKMPHPGWKVNLISKYSPQYTAGGGDGIIDGL